jgi:hypothetical protein
MPASVAHCIPFYESRYQWWERNSATATGLFQIIDSSWPSQLRYLDHKDPYVNAIAAGILYKERGLQPWSGDPCA